MSTKRVTRSTRNLSENKVDIALQDRDQIVKRTKPLARTSQSTETKQVADTKKELHRDDAPSTPPRKKAKRSPRFPPETPTPAAVGLMAALYSTGDIDDAIPPPSFADRPAEPHITNALLKTPGGSRVATYTADNITSSSSPTSVPKPTTTTNHLLNEACAHLINVDPRLKAVIEQNHCQIFSPEGLAEEVDPFRSLASGIMAQQVSGAAATSIKKKFIGLFNDTPADGAQPVAWKFPTPTQVAAKDVSFVRQAGLSGRKAEYIIGLAEKFAAGELSAKMLADASYDEMLEKLTAVRGLGKWSVEMFACFALKRMDVFSTGDLGVQ